MKGQAKYEWLVEEFIRLMEEGTIPWRQPWFCRFPCNLTTRKDYRGINVWALNYQAQQKGFGSRYWVTEKQAAMKGGRIKEAERSRGSWIVFGRWVFKKWKDRNGIEHRDVRLLLRSYIVFNYEQTEGLERLLPKEHHLKFEPVEMAEQIVAGYKDSPQLVRDCGRAFYAPFFDQVGMPDKSQFATVQSYYATLFHELTHSTGHPKRLNRFSFCDACFGDERYAREELVAEIGSALLCAKAGLLNETIKNSAAYLQSWLHALKDDKACLFWAASNSQKACGFVLGIRPKKEENPHVNGEAKNEKRESPSEIGDVRWE